MWSENYNYLNIYKDETLSITCGTQELSRFIAGMPDLIQASEFEFKNKESFPFVRLLLLNAKRRDRWSSLDTDSRCTNLISIICEKEDCDYSRAVQSALIQIASFLEWKLVDEETDDGIEYFTIWEP